VWNRKPNRRNKNRVPDARGMAADVTPSMAEKIETLPLEKGWKDVGTRVRDIRSLDAFEDNTNFVLLILKGRGNLVKSTREISRLCKKRVVCVVISWAGTLYLPAPKSHPVLLKPT